MKSQLGRYRADFEVADKHFRKACLCVADFDNLYFMMSTEQVETAVSLETQETAKKTPLKLRIDIIAGNVIKCWHFGGNLCILSVAIVLHKVARQS